MLMKIFVSMCAMVSISSVAIGQLDEVNEPAPEVCLEVNGKVLPVSHDEAIEIKIKDETVSVRLKQSSERVLNLQHISFKYPAYFKYSVSRHNEVGEPVRWDLEGHEIDLTVFRLRNEDLRYGNPEHPLSDYVAKTFEYGTAERKCPILSITDFDLNGNGYSIPFKAGLVETELWVDIYEVPGNFENVRYFLFLSDWDGTDPKEESLMRKLLVESFTIREEPLNPEWRVKYDD